MAHKRPRLTKRLRAVLALYPPPQRLRNGPNDTADCPDDAGVVSVSLTQDVTGLVDAADWSDIMHRYRWYALFSPARWGWHSRWVMRATLQGGGQVLAHTLIAALAGFEAADVIDHIEHRGPHDRIIDNRRCNLRPASYAENAAAARRMPDSFRGVLQLPSGRWRAAIRRHGKREHLGTFDTDVEAAAAYDAAALDTHGSFATLNLDEVPF